MKSARQLLAGMRTRARLGIAVEALGCFGAALVVHGLVSYALDRWLDLEVPFRAVLLIALVAVIWRTASRRLAAPLRTTLDDDELALAVERHDPELRQALISALEFDEDLRAGRDHGESSSMMRTVIDDVERRAAGIAFARALDRRRVAAYLGLALASLAIGASWLTFGGTEARIWLQRDLLLGSVAWPRDTWLSWTDVDPAKPLRIAEREDLRLSVTVTDVVPERVDLHGRFTGGQTFTRPMDRVGARRFAVTLETILEGAEVVAIGGDGETPPLVIQLVPRPRVTDLGVEVNYPEYMDRDPESLLATGGDLRVPRGASLTLTATCTKALKRAELVFEDDRRTAAEIVEPDLARIRAQFAPQRTGSLRLELLDTDDLGPVTPPQLHIRVVDDAAPSLDFETSGVGSSITPNARIPGVLRVRDDYGVARVAAAYRTASATSAADGSRTDEPPFRPAPVNWLDELETGATEVDLGVVFDLLPILVDPDPTSAANPIRPGVLLSLRFEGHDVRTPEANRGESEVLNLRVVSREELLEELTRRQLEQRRDLERVLEQEIEARAELSEIVSSTSDDPRARSARLRTQNLARQQLAIAKKTQGIAERYARIVAEMTNNRVYEPAIPRGLETRIVAPMGRLARDDIPLSAGLVERFATAGDESSRDECIRSYGDIIEAMRALLAQMERTESIAALVESLRGIIRTEREVNDLIERLRAEQGEGVFDPPGGRDDGRNR